MRLSVARRNPFEIVFLPLIGRLHRNSFRSGSANSSSLGRLLSRMLFYPLKSLSFSQVLGELKVKISNVERIAPFDARNRQYSALYFDVFSAGYEPEFTTIIDALVPDNGVLFDIGSNWGFFSIHLAARPGFEGRVHAFEPWPPTYLDLARLVEELELGQCIDCHAVALNDIDGHASMQSPSHSGLARISGNGNGKKVRTTTLDNLDLPPPTLMKIDAEGAEDKILQGGRRFLAKHHPMLLFENRAQRFGGNECLAVLVMLEEIGYQLFAPNLISSTAGQHQVELIRITADTRKDHAEYPNLFACHSSDTGRLMEAVDR